MVPPRGPTGLTKVDEDSGSLLFLCECERLRPRNVVPAALNTFMLRSYRHRARRLIWDNRNSYCLMEAVAVVTTGRISRRRDGDALITRVASASELTDDPAVGEVVI